MPICKNCWFPIGTFLCNIIIKISYHKLLSFFKTICIAHFSVQKLTPNLLQLDLINLFTAFPTTDLSIIICLEILTLLSFPLKLYFFWILKLLCVWVFIGRFKKMLCAWRIFCNFNNLGYYLYFFCLGNSRVFLSFVALPTLVLSLDDNLFCSFVKDIFTFNWLSFFLCRYFWTLGGE